MRYLHPVGIHEAFVASGSYVKMRDDTLISGWLEEWSIHQQPDKANLIRVDLSDRASRLSMIIEAWVSPPQEGRRIERLDISAYGGPDSPVKYIRATYTFSDDTVAISSKRDGDAHYREVALPATAVPYVETAFFTGWTAAKVTTHDTPTLVTTIAADITTLGETPHMVTWSSTTNIAASLQLGSRVYQARQINLIRAGTPLPSLWIDEHGILLKQPLVEDDAAIVLKDYARSRR